MTFNLRHAETLRVRHFLQQNLCAAALMAISADRAADVFFNYVIAKDDTDGRTIGEILGE